MHNSFATIPVEAKRRHHIALMTYFFSVPTGGGVG